MGEAAKPEIDKLNLTTIRLLSQETTGRDPVIAPGFTSGRPKGHRTRLGPSSGRRRSFPEFFKQKPPVDHIGWSIFRPVVFFPSQTRCTLSVASAPEFRDGMWGCRCSPVGHGKYTVYHRLGRDDAKAPACSARRSGRHRAGGSLCKPNQTQAFPVLVHLAEHTYT